MLMLIFVAFTSCHKEDTAGIAVSVGVDISIQNVDGVDLLNPENELSFKERYIDVYEIINGVKTKIFDGNLDYTIYII